MHFHCCYDNRFGRPLYGYAMLPTLDEFSRIAQLLHNGGNHDGVQLLSRTKLAETIGRDLHIGLPTGWRNDDGKMVTYHMSMWQTQLVTRRGAAASYRWRT